MAQSLSPGPLLPGSLHQRPLGPDDPARWADLLAAVEALDRRGEHYDAEDCVEELADPEVDFAHDSVLVLDGNVPVAYQVLRRRDGGIGGPRLVSDGAVRPAYRRLGVGSALVGLGLRWAAELGMAFTMRVAETNAGAGALAQRSGLVPVRWWSELRRDLTGPVAPAELPPGLTLHPLGPGLDRARWDGPLRAAHNAAFADHWGSTAVPPEVWAHWYTGGRAFRPACSAAACTPDGAVAGYLLGEEYEADTARTGTRELWVATIGTVAAWRGRGVASALLAHALRTAAAEGYARSALTVDAQNPTGALGVYERAGYRVDRREVTYVGPR